MHKNKTTTATNLFTADYSQTNTVRIYVEQRKKNNIVPRTPKQISAAAVVGSDTDKLFISDVHVLFIETTEIGLRLYI